MSEEKFDLVVIGGGPGGYVAAIRAAQLGMKTALVEREHLGGICLNWGCIPTKAFLHTADTYRQMRNMRALGLKADGVSVDFKQVVARSRAVAGQLNKGVRHLLKKNKVMVYEGHGRLLAPGKIRVTRHGDAEAMLGAEHIILATGARPRDIPGVEVDGVRVWNYRHALMPASLPESLLVIGAGAIGMEFASFYSTLGSKVTVVEARERVLPSEDEEISAFVSDAFEKQGIAIRTGASVKGIEKSDAGVTVALHDKQGAERIRVKYALISVGIVGNTEGLGLEVTKVRTESGHVVTDQWGRTEEPGIYAIGDVAGPPWLAHKASHQGMLCVETIAGREDIYPLERHQIPACTYCYPQTASIGLTERAARDRGYALRIGRFPFLGNGKAIALGEQEGFIKTVFDADTGEVLGAHMVGPEVTELIHGFAVAKRLEATEVDLMHTVFPHPSLSEALHESVLAAFDRALHI